MAAALRYAMLLLLTAACCIQLVGQEVVDGIAARVEGDVILISEVRELRSYQKLVDGKSENDAQILDRLIDQWVVRTEAETSRFPLPSDADVQRNVERLQKSFASPAEFEARKQESGLSDSELRAISAAQLYLSNYLDSRFRPSVQIDTKAVEDYYQNGVVLRAKARGQEPPTLEAAREFIQEFLTQEGINEQTDRWLKESRVHLHVEKLLDQVTK